MSFVFDSKVGLLLGLLACAPSGCDSSTACEDNGGVRVRGVCVCPPGTRQQGNLCLGDTDASAAPDAASPAVAPNDGGDSAVRSRDMDSAPDASATDAGPSDASAPEASSLDAGSADASVNADGEPDAGADGGPRCSATGNFVTTYYEHPGGTCGASIAPFTIMLHGELGDSLKNESDCQLTAQASPDGCSLSYEQICPLPEPTKLWHEVGTVTMISPTHIVGSAHVTVDDSMLSSKDMQCQSDVDIIIDAAKM